MILIETVFECLMRGYKFGLDYIFKTWPSKFSSML
jgi:hypothetical protein